MTNTAQQAAATETETIKPAADRLAITFGDQTFEEIHDLREYMNSADAADLPTLHMLDWMYSNGAGDYDKRDALSTINKLVEELQHLHSQIEQAVTMQDFIKIAENTWEIRWITRYAAGLKENLGKVAQCSKAFVAFETAQRRTDSRLQRREHKAYLASIAPTEDEHISTPRSYAKAEGCYVWHISHGYGYVRSTCSTCSTYSSRQGLDIDWQFPSPHGTIYSPKLKEAQFVKDPAQYGMVYDPETRTWDNA